MRSPDETHDRAEFVVTRAARSELPASWHDSENWGVAWIMAKACIMHDWYLQQVFVHQLSSAPGFADGRWLGRPCVFGGSWRNGSDCDVLFGLCE